MIIDVDITYICLSHFVEDTSICDMEGTDDVAVPSKKKRVSWASNDNLIQVHYFQMDDSERGTRLGFVL